MAKQSYLNLAKNWVNSKVDVSALKINFHYFFLLGVSIFVGMQMESQMSSFKQQTKNSISEREYEQNKTYEQIMSQIKEFDGTAVPIDREEETLPVYKYEHFEEDWVSRN